MPQSPLLLIHDVNAATSYLSHVDLSHAHSHYAEDTVANGTVTAESGQLAHTGAEIEGPASIAVALLALGTLLAFGTRSIRRTRGQRKD